MEDEDLVDEVNWKVMQRFVNETLKEGMIREAVLWKDANERVKRYRHWLQHRTKVYKPREDEEEY